MRYDGDLSGYLTLLWTEMPNRRCCLWIIYSAELVHILTQHLMDSVYKLYTIGNSKG